MSGRSAATRGATGEPQDPRRHPHRDPFRRPRACALAVLSEHVGRLHRRAVSHVPVDVRGGVRLGGAIFGGARGSRMSNVQKHPRCKHGMDSRFCALCSPPEPMKLRASPGHRTRLSSPTLREVTPTLAHALGAKEYNYVLVRTTDCNRTNPGPTFSELSSRTTKVHIAGLPFLWAVEEILRRAPNLKVFQVIPTQLRHMSAVHMGLLQAR